MVSMHEGKVRFRAYPIINTYSSYLYSKQYTRTNVCMTMCGMDIPRQLACSGSSERMEAFTEPSSLSTSRSGDSFKTTQAESIPVSA